MACFAFSFIMVNAHIFFGGPLVALLVLSMVAMCCYCRRKSISERNKQNQYEAELHMRELGDADSEVQLFFAFLSWFLTVLRLMVLSWFVNV